MRNQHWQKALAKTMQQQQTRGLINAGVRPRAVRAAICTLGIGHWALGNPLLQSPLLPCQD